MEALCTANNTVNNCTLMPKKHMAWNSLDATNGVQKLQQ